MHCVHTESLVKVQHPRLFNFLLLVLKSQTKKGWKTYSGCSCFEKIVFPFETTNFFAFLPSLHLRLFIFASQSLIGSRGRRLFPATNRKGVVPCQASQLERCLAQQPIKMCTQRKNNAEHLILKFFLHSASARNRILDPGANNRHK